MLTGDIGTVDADGYLAITGPDRGLHHPRWPRTSAPPSWRRQSAAHPAVAQAAVVAVPDPILGERVCAYVVPRGTLALDALRVHLDAPGVSKQNWPEYLVALPSLPLGTGGKVDKAVPARRRRPPFPPLTAASAPALITERGDLAARPRPRCRAAPRDSVAAWVTRRPTETWPRPRGAWVLGQVRHGDDGPWLPDSVGDDPPADRRPGTATRCTPASPASRPSWPRSRLHRALTAAESTLADGSSRGSRRQAADRSSHRSTTASPVT